MLAALLVFAGGAAAFRAPPRPTRLQPTRYVFDFFQRAGEDFTALVERRAREDALALARLSEGLAKSRDVFARDLAAVFDGGRGRTLDASLAALEDALLGADLGAATVDAVLRDARAAAAAGGEFRQADVTAALRGRLVEALGAPAPLAANAGGLSVVLVIGANGMGKTTTIGKLARRLREEAGQRVLLAACDTFRAAAADQLDEWARRARVDIVRPDAGAVSPAAAAYKAVDVALGKRALEAAGRHAEGSGPYGVLIVDTSGRLANNAALTEELAKIQRTLSKRVAGAPHETLLVVDAAVGRNAVDQARAWRRAVGVSGLAVTKLDGTARAGFVVAVARDLGIPVKLVGVGEGLDDLRDFDAEPFVDSLLDVDAADVGDLRRRFAELTAAPPPAKKKTRGKRRGP
mmetsp:Transcript_7227/g.21328  ORF Transcript_7227/g.21328 Transcript_7227/m.21328 type:complete len:406 (+) Transcript_7227:95-1312(+)